MNELIECDLKLLKEPANNLLLNGGNRINLMALLLNNIEYNRLINEQHNLFYQINKSDNIQRNQNTKYMGNGSYSLVCVIDKYSDITFTNKLDGKYIIKFFISGVIYNKDLFIDKYKYDKKLFPNNIPSLYYIGKIIKDGSLLQFLFPMNSKNTKEYYNLSYVISKIYNTKLIDLNINARIYFFYNLLLFLKSLNDKNMFLCDLKLSNVACYNSSKGTGQTISISNYDIVIIDYDEMTLRNNAAKYPKNSPFIVNTYFAPHIFLQKTNDNNKYNNYLKSEVGGLAEIITQLFFLNTKPLYIFNNTTYTNYKDKNKISEYVKMLSKQNDVPIKLSLLLKSFLYSDKYTSLMQPIYKYVSSYTHLAKEFKYYINNNIETKTMRKYPNSLTILESDIKNIKPNLSNTNNILINQSI